MHKRLRRGPWSLAARLLVAWLVLAVAGALSPCCEGVTSIFSGAAEHADGGAAGDSHDHAQASGHALCATALDHESQALPTGSSPIFQAALLLAFFVGLLAMPLVSPLSWSSAPPFPPRSPLYLRFGHLLN
ncbi:hypothetical protein SVA_3283 [Sulfurifustis variabilis]|uniref:Uncharacterized protein n=1 Tax=Sulfurifustis variabilis TaxID=1675686 RepID=A0A1B4VCV9_9GAMM|nr:hypothetical protein SVA_3283 [Sulfurifustis variabilis]